MFLTETLISRHFLTINIFILVFLIKQINSVPLEVLASQDDLRDLQPADPWLYLPQGGAAWL